MLRAASLIFLTLALAGCVSVSPTTDVAEGAVRITPVLQIAEDAVTPTLAVEAGAVAPSLDVAEGAVSIAPTTNVQERAVVIEPSLAVEKGAVEQGALVVSPSLTIEPGAVVVPTEPLEAGLDKLGGHLAGAIEVLGNQALGGVDTRLGALESSMRLLVWAVAGATVCCVLIIGWLGFRVTRAIELDKLSERRLQQIQAEQLVGHELPPINGGGPLVARMPRVDASGSAEG